MKRNRKRDANEPEIIAILEYVGASVYPLDKPLDLLVGIDGDRTEIIEVKNPDGANRIEPDQKEFFQKWKGKPATIVRNQKQALMSIGFGEVAAEIAIKKFHRSQEK